MTSVVQVVMLAFGAFILFATKVKAYDISKSSVFNAGMIAVVSIFGFIGVGVSTVVAWGLSRVAF